MESYKTLYEQVREEIEKTRPTDTGKVAVRGVQPSSVLTDSLNQITDVIRESLLKGLKARMITGLEVEAEATPSFRVLVRAGEGYLGGHIIKLGADTTIEVILGSPRVWYVNLTFTGSVDLDLAPSTEKLALAKIVVPYAGTLAIQDDKPADGLDGYIVSGRDLLFDNSFQIDDDTIGRLRNLMSTLLAENLIGNIRLSEDLRITNTAGTLEMDSKEIRIKDAAGKLLSKFTRNGVYFFNDLGQELARYTGTEGRVGNMRLLPHSIQSGNFVADTSGFQITDAGQAEFEDAKIRGRIVSAEGEIGGWIIGADTLKSDNEWIILDSSTGVISTKNAVSYQMKIYPGGITFISKWLRVVNYPVDPADYIDDITLKNESMGVISDVKYFYGRKSGELIIKSAYAAESDFDVGKKLYITYTLFQIVDGEVVIASASGGETNAFLDHGNVADGTYIIYKNDSPLIKVLHYSLNLATGEVTFVTPLSPGDNIKADYSYMSTHTDEEHTVSLVERLTDFLNEDSLVDVQHVKNLNVGTADILDLSVTNGKILSLSADKITAGTIDADKINVTNLVASDSIQAGTLTVESDIIAPDCIDSADVAEADGTSGQDTNTGSGIKTGHIQHEAVGTDQLEKTDDADKIKLANIGNDLKSLFPRNTGSAWIAHGDNVITLPDAHTSGDYRGICTLRHAPMGGITTRGPAHTRPMSVSIQPETATRLKARLYGGYGFTSCGSSNHTERFDDVANTQTARADATARRWLAGYSLNGYGFTSCGYIATWTGITERFDDVANTHTGRASATARYELAGYSLNGYGFTSCGDGASSGLTERFDDVANSHTARANAGAEHDLAGYSLNGYGFISCGSGPSGLTQRFDDVANTHTGRANATARFLLTGYSLNGYGFTSCGYTPGATGLTERFDDVANTHTGRASATARFRLAGYSLNGYGFTSCGHTGYDPTGLTQRFDDMANSHTGRTSATAREYLTGYATNEYFVDYATIGA